MSTADQSSTPDADHAALVRARVRARKARLAARAALGKALPKPVIRGAGKVVPKGVDPDTITAPEPTPMPMPIGTRTGPDTA